MYLPSAVFIAQVLVGPGAHKIKITQFDTTVFFFYKKP